MNTACNKLAEWLRRLLLVPLIAGCSGDAGTTQQQALVQAPYPAQPQVQAEIEDALGFTVEYGDGYKILRVFSHWQSEAEAYHYEYLLVSRGAEVPTQFDDMPLIRTPIQRLITTSPTQSALLAPFQAEHVLVGHSNTEVWDETIQRGIADGSIATVGRTANLNTELVLALAPDVFMGGSSPSESQASYSIFEESGIVVIPNAEYLEQSVLGRAEWVKLMGILLNREQQAEQFYDTVKSDYLALRELASQVSDKPLILTGTPNRGVWYQPGGRSYVAELFTDAGGDYPWIADDNVGSFGVSFEEMMQLGLKADIWLHASGNEARLDHLQALDVRLAQMRPFQSGQVYNFTRRLQPNGANDYWETGIIHPERLLADLISILHPQLLPDHELAYYRKFQ